jgi:dynein heavy chain
MKVSLAAVQRALVGEIVMTEDLEAIASCMFNNTVPPGWAKVGFLSMKPLASWINDCNDRIDFLDNWIATGTPIKFWFSGFFFPQAFLTGTLQNYARKNNIPIDRVAFNYDFRDDITHEDIKERPDDGVFVFGLFLEGCKWDFNTHVLAESDPKKLFQELPLLHLVPVIDRVKPVDGIYLSPTYRILSRQGTLSTTGHSTNFVINLELPSADKSSKWILAGVACFLALRF